MNGLELARFTLDCLKRYRVFIFLLNYQSISLMCKRQKLERFKAAQFYNKNIFRTVAPALTESTNTLVNVHRNSAESFAKSNPWLTSCTHKPHRASITTASTASASSRRAATATSASVLQATQVSRLIKWHSTNKFCFIDESIPGLDID